jgi:hypothetical protein
MKKFLMRKDRCMELILEEVQAQDPNYPEGHPKIKEQEAHKKKSIARKSPNEHEDNENSKYEDFDVSISDAETGDGNNEENL